MWGGGAALSRDQADEVVGCESLSLRGARLDLRPEYDFFRGVVPRMRRLLVVDLSRTRLSDHHAPLLHELARPGRGLLSLDASRNDMGTQCLEVLAECLSRHTSLQRLDVSRNLNFVRHMALAKKLGGAAGACRTLTSLGVSFPEQVRASMHACMRMRVARPQHGSKSCMHASLTGRSMWCEGVLPVASF